MHAQGAKQSVCPLVIVGMKIARSLVLGICACCKYKKSVDIGVSTRFNLLKMGSSTIQIMHARAQCRKGSSSHNNSSAVECKCVAILRHNRARGPGYVLWRDLV